VLVPQEGFAVSEPELEAFCRREIADYRRPKAFFRADALPRNAYGKVLKRELRDRLDSLATPL
jgi:acyl-CoA synthetase (AMP-forming)/AMP-acid ligase II